LDEIHLRLDHAIAATNERLERIPQGDAAATADARQDEIAKWCARLQRLSVHLDSTEQIVQSVDEILQKEETVLRQQLTKSASLRQKLAETAGRAIG
jgi:hypothetical protein